MDIELIPISISDTYGILSPNNIINWNGFEAETPHTQNLIKTGKSKLFMPGNKLFPYLSHHLDSNTIKQYVILLIPGLRNKYYERRHLLPKDEQILLNLSMLRPMPNMVFNGDDNNPLYQVHGHITPFDIISFPVPYFIRYINQSLPIKVILDPIDIVIEVQYKLYDFWDKERQKLITYIKI